MRRITIALLGSALLWACGDGGDPSDTTPIPDPEDWRFSIYEGREAETEVATVVDSIRGQLYGVDAATPYRGQFSTLAAPVVAQGIPGEDVCADIRDPDRYRIRPVCQTTDSLGTIVAEGVVGTLTGTYCVGFYAVRDGAVEAVDSSCVTARPGPVAVVTLDRDEEVLDVGQRVLLRNHVSAVDQYGNSAPLGQLSVSVDSPLVVSLDTLWSDVETAGWVRVSAETGAADSATVTVLNDFGSGWEYELKCANGVTELSAGQVDSVVVRMVIDSAKFGSPQAGWIRSGLAFVTQSAGIYIVPGTSDAEEDVQYTLSVSQRVGAMSLTIRTPHRDKTDYLMVADSTGEAMYVGSGICGTAETVVDEMRAPEP